MTWIVEFFTEVPVPAWYALAVLIFAAVVTWMRQGLKKAAKEEIHQLNADQSSFRQDLLATIAELKGEVATLKLQMAELQIENTKLKQQLIIMESAHQDLPLPMWIKDPGGVVLSVNPKYEEVFLRPRGHARSDYVGSDDYAIWPEPAAKEFRQNDAQVLATGAIMDAIEHVPNSTGKLVPWRIIKFRRYDLSSGVIIGIAGIAISPNPVEFDHENA